MDTRPVRVCLERTVELEGARLGLRDWPGLGGPLVHIPDPTSGAADAVEAIAATLAWRYRVLSLRPRGASPYQVDAVDILDTLEQFGFVAPVLVGERLGCVAALLAAAWHVGRLAGVVLIDPVYDPPTSDGIAARALRDCPPHWPAVHDAVTCPVLRLGWDPGALEELERFLSQLAPLVN